MWTKFAGKTENIYARNHREFSWVCHQRGVGEAVIDTCQVDAFGWVIYNMVLRVWVPGIHSGIWETSYHLALIEGGSLIRVYSLTESEYETHPGMPDAWWVPF